ncbi:MAG TPA: ribose-phosphate pyrophosphokinase [Trueperaceae bacterium]|nr:ribose-phosphate pyrophosphokinase [Trueperaceae bacterium]
MRIGDDVKLFRGTSTPALAAKVAANLEVPLASGTVSQFPDGETRITIEESVRGADCYIVQSTCAPVNHNLMELLVLIDALRRASAWRINAVIPYFGYARQDKKVQAREPITAKLVANLLETAGADRVITVDLHAGQIQGFFDVPVDHLTALSILGEHLKDQNDLEDAIVVSPDIGRATEARRLANYLNLPLAMLYKRRNSPTDTEVTHVIGEVEGKRPIIIDDMISTAGTMRRGIEALLSLGAVPDVRVTATHAVFTPPAMERLTHPAIKGIYVTDTVPLRNERPDITVLSVAPLLAKAIQNVHDHASVSSLFTT